MRKLVVMVIALALFATAMTAGSGASAPSGGERDTAARAGQAFEFQVRKIRGKTKRRMTGPVWRKGCPVGLGKLRVIRMTHWNFDGKRKFGALVIHENETTEIVRVFRRLYRQKFSIRRMFPIEKYGGDDHRSMNADNTSAFNCRVVNGTSRWSQHAYGKAIDLNPIENPYVTSSGFVSPPAGAPYADRSRNSKGMVHRGDVVVGAFRNVDWKWGGNWSGTKDYQHFSRNGH